MADELWQAFVQIAGAVNALLLGVALISSPRLHRTRSRRKLGLAFLGYGYLLFSFTAIDNFWIPAAWWIWLVDYFVALLASALFLDYMGEALGQERMSRLIYVPPVLILVLAPLFGPEFVAGPAIHVTIALQLGYSTWTTWVYLAARRELTSRPHHLAVLLVGLWALHAFQFSNLMIPGVGWLFDAVPLVGAALMLSLTVLVLTDPRTLRNLSQVTATPTPSSIDRTVLDRYMSTECPHLDPQLSADQLAAALGISRRELSRVFESIGGGNFYQFVNQYRAREARQLLSDPSERRTSIEAIGLMSGFRARSTFYDAFRRETGKTPAQFRIDLETPEN